VFVGISYHLANTGRAEVNDTTYVGTVSAAKVTNPASIPSKETHLKIHQLLESGHIFELYYEDMMYGLDEVYYVLVGHLNLVCRAKKLCAQDDCDLLSTAQDDNVVIFVHGALQAVREAEEKKRYIVRLEDEKVVAAFATLLRQPLWYERSKDGEVESVQLRFNVDYEAALGVVSANNYRAIPAIDYEKMSANYAKIGRTGLWYAELFAHVECTRYADAYIGRKQELERLGYEIMEDSPSNHDLEIICKRIHRALTAAPKRILLAHEADVVDHIFTLIEANQMPLVFNVSKNGQKGVSICGRAGGRRRDRPSYKHFVTDCDAGG